MIPDEAVEAAKEVAWSRYGSKPDDAYLRTLLEAAAPHLTAHLDQIPADHLIDEMD